MMAACPCFCRGCAQEKFSGGTLPEMSYLMSGFCRFAHYLTAANTIEMAVLLVIVYDVVWHRWNAGMEIKREEAAEASTIQREKEAEKRQIIRERQESIRKHWQELQSNLISLHRVASNLAQHKVFVKQNKNSQNPTTRRALQMMVTRLPEELAEFNDRWGRVVAQLNVFPQPRDPLALEVLELAEELEKTMRDSEVEVKDETLLALANLAKRVADVATLPNPD
jgi:hypothetical protein